MSVTRFSQVKESHLFRGSIIYWLDTLDNNGSDGFNVPPEVFNGVVGYQGPGEFILICFNMRCGYSAVCFSQMGDYGRE